MVSIASGELPEVVGSAPEKLWAREMRRARENKVLRRHRDRRVVVSRNRARVRVWGLKMVSGGDNDWDFRGLGG